MTETIVEDPSRAGKVVSQEPLPGFPVDVGGPVTLTVAVTAKTPPQPGSVWITRNFPLDHTEHKVEIWVESDAGRRKVADEWVPGGRGFRRFVPLAPGESPRLWVDGRPE